MSVAFDIVKAFLLVSIVGLVSACGGGGSDPGPDPQRVVLSSNANLAALTLSSGVALAPSFQAGTTDYSATAGFLISTLRVAPTAADPAASITVNGVSVGSGQQSQLIALAVGNGNAITIAVTAEDGTTSRVYQLAITREGNAALSSLGLSSGTLDPAFQPNVLSYASTVAFAVDSLSVTPAAADGSAAITVNGAEVASGQSSAPIVLAEGSNPIQIAVAAAGGASRIYTVAVFRQAEDDPVEETPVVPVSFADEINPIFAAQGCTACHLPGGIGFLQSGLDLTQTPAGNCAALKSGRVDLGTPADSKILRMPDDNSGIGHTGGKPSVFESPSGEAYSLILSWIEQGAPCEDEISDVPLPPPPPPVDGEARLSAILFNEAVDLTPVFNPDVFDYTGTVPFGITSIRVGASSMDADASIEIDGQSLGSGQLSAPKVLLPGQDRTIALISTAPDGLTRLTYTFSITRLVDDTEARLSAILFNEAVDLSPAFDPDVFDYTGTVPFGITSIRVGASSMDADASIEIDGQLLGSGQPSAPMALFPGQDRTITVLVTAPDGTSTRTYTLTITRLPSNEFTIGGRISGLAGTGLVVMLNGGMDFWETSLNGPFAFEALLKTGDDYEVTVNVQPSKSFCTVSNSSGIVDAVNIKTADVTCVPIITTVAGNGINDYSGDGGPATSASLDSPGGVAVDAAGNLYIADTFNNRIRKVSTDGVISTVAGDGAFDGFIGDGGPATSAFLASPYGVAVDAAGNLYIAHSSLIRKVGTDGVISTVAGNGSFGYNGDGGPATSARLDSPQGVAVDAAGNLYIADSNNSRIRKVSTDGVISTVAGNGSSGYSGDGGPAASAFLNYPYGVAVDEVGNLYIADYLNSRIRKVSTDGVISTVAGNGSSGYSGDGGPATSASLYYPLGVAVDAAGNLYIADSNNSRIRKVSTDGVISTVAGNGSSGYGGDGGPATSASLYSSRGVAVDANGGIYIADRFNMRIRYVSASPPDAPAFLTASAGIGEVILIWDAVDGATSYNIYQSTMADEQSAAPIQIGIAETSTVISGLVNGTTYYFTVVAVNANGTSAPSNEASATPLAQGAPASPILSTPLAGFAEVTLNWTGVNGAAGYNVYQGTVPGAATLVLSNIVGTSATITDLTNGTTYYFTVAAVNANGTSAPSNEVSANTAVPTPGNLQVTALGTTSITLAWDISDESGVTKYQIYRNNVLVATTMTRSFTDSVTPDSTYEYQVSALGSSGGESPRSGISSATTLVSYAININGRFGSLGCTGCHYRASSTNQGIGYTQSGGDANNGLRLDHQAPVDNCNVIKSKPARANATPPTNSLILTKPTLNSGVTHGPSGVDYKFPEFASPASSGTAYSVILRWIEQGAVCN